MCYSEPKLINKNAGSIFSMNDTVIQCMSYFASCCSRGVLQRLPSGNLSPCFRQSVWVHYKYLSSRFILIIIISFLLFMLLYFVVGYALAFASILYRVWRARYNFSHDQLVLTCGSDSRVLLHGAQSISSSPITETGKNEECSSSGSSSNNIESHVQEYEEHIDK